MAGKAGPRKRQLKLFSEKRIMDALGLSGMTKRKTGEEKKEDIKRMRNQAPSKAAYAFQRFKKSGLLQNVLTSVPLVGTVLNLNVRDTIAAIGRSNPFLATAIGAGKFFFAKDEAFEEHQQIYETHQRRMKLLQKANKVRAEKRADVKDSLDSTEALLRIMIKRSDAHIQKMLKRPDIVGKNKGNLRFVGYKNRETDVKNANKKLTRIEKIPNNMKQPMQGRVAAELTNLMMATAKDLGRWKNMWESKGFKRVPKFKKGGEVKGPGTGTSDSVDIKASNGEFVVSEKGVKKIGKKALEQINKGDFEDVKPMKKKASMKDASMEDLLKELQKISSGIKEQSDEEKEQAARQEAIQIEAKETTAEQLRDQKTWQEKLLKAVAMKPKTDEKKSGLFGFLQNLRGLSALMNIMTKIGPMFSAILGAGKTLLGFFRTFGGALMRFAVPIYTAFQVIQNVIEGFSKDGVLGAISGIFEGLAEAASGLIKLPAMLFDALFGTNIGEFIDKKLDPLIENIGESITFLIRNIGDIFMNLPKILIGLLISAVSKIPGVGKLIPDSLKNWATDFSGSDTGPAATRTNPHPEQTKPPVRQMPPAATKTAPQTRPMPTATPTTTRPRVSGLAQETEANRQVQQAVNNIPVVISAPQATTIVNPSGNNEQTPPANPRNTDSTMQRLNQQAFSAAV